MKTKIKYLLAGLITAFGLSTFAGSQKNPTPQSFKVLGNCGMCKKTIEKAALKTGASKAEWNKETKMLSVQYNPKKMTADDILKSVAYAGYDNEKYLAPTESYNNLHECCKYDRVKVKQTTFLPSAQTNILTNSKPTQEVQNKNELESVYNSYFNMKDALIKADSKTAAMKAKELVDALNAVKMTVLNTTEHNTFMKYLTDLKTDAGKIYETKAIDKQRELFSSLSNKMYELMKVIKPPFPAYVDYCPMYNDGKGAYWISKENAIKNPYYGSQMMSCGKVKEIIK